MLAKCLCLGCPINLSYLRLTTANRILDIVDCVALLRRRRRDLVLSSRTATCFLSIYADKAVLSRIFRIVDHARGLVSGVFFEFLSRSLEQSLDSGLVFILLVHCNVFNRFVDLAEKTLVCNHASFMSLREYMLVVVCKLLSAYGTDQVSGTWLRLFDLGRPLFGRCELGRLFC